MKKNKKISVAIITFNAERSIRECLESVKYFDEIIIVDSGSSDKTLEIAKEYTDKIYRRGFDDFSSQKNYAISQTTGEWVLSLDADEIITPELKNEIAALDLNTHIEGFYIERLNNIYGEFVKYGRPDLQLRLFKKDCGRFNQPVHERICIDKNRTSRINSKILHYTMKDISHHLIKLEEFTNYDVNYYPVKKITFLWIINNLFVRPALKFIQHYFIKKAYKDGLKGYIFSVITVMGEFITSAKQYERSVNKQR